MQKAIGTKGRTDDSGAKSNDGWQKAIESQTKTVEIGHREKIRSPHRPVSRQYPRIFFSDFTAAFLLVAFSNVGCLVGLRSLNNGYLRSSKSPRAR